MSPRRVLVVEDSEPCLRIYSIVLGRAGYVVTVARSVPEAIFSLQKEMPDVLVCDLLLGTIGNGFDVIAVVRSTEGKVFCVAVTALITPGMEEQALARGFDAFFRKPFNPSKLVELLLKK